MIKEVLSILMESIRNNDFYILVFAIVTLGVYLFALWAAFSISRKAKQWKMEKNKQFSRFLYFTAKVGDTVFTSFSSLFPLLGMFGTVGGLIGLDWGAGDMENIKYDFFVALTSTAWGIVFSCIFKVIYAFSRDYMEAKIELSHQLTEGIR